jgi:3-deoxy-manno-octulosonate cytidylyltransferase (CMP-KDO synthetase)
MKILGIIPARYASTRFPGKPLADICGKSMIQRVYERVSAASLTKVVVATDDQRIASHVARFGGEVMLTGSHHANGTSRCLEVVKKLESQGLFFDIILNIQGDEPLISPEQIGQLVALFREKETQIATLAHPIRQTEELFDPNAVKVVTGSGKKALYFSRQAIPFVRGQKPETWLQHAGYLKHLGIYAFRTQILKELVLLPEGKLEPIEKLEQLRWLEKGFSIKVETTDYEGVGVDTPEDLQKLINKICKGQKQ